MLSTRAHILSLPILLTAACGVGGCAQQSEVTQPLALDEAPIQYGLSASNERFGAEALFGEWVTQIVRRAPRDKQGPPWVYESGVYADTLSTDLRPKLDLTLAEDGSYTLITNYSQQTNDRKFSMGLWTIGGGKVTLQAQQEEFPWVFTYRGGKLVTEKEDGSQLILGRR